MKDKGKKETKFRKTKFGSRKFLHSTGTASIACSFENYAEEDWEPGPDIYLSISSGGQEIYLYDFKDIKKVSVMLHNFVTQVEAVK